jgi:hypothetical protein
MENTKIYPKGLFVNSPREGAPDFVGDSLAFTKEFANWLNENPQLFNDKGYLRMDILTGREDKPYAVVNTYGLDSASAPTKTETAPLHVDGDLPF